MLVSFYKTLHCLCGLCLQKHVEFLVHVLNFKQLQNAGTLKTRLCADTACHQLLILHFAVLMNKILCARISPVLTEFILVFFSPCFRINKIVP